MESFRLALVQHASPVRAKARNLDLAEAFARKAKRAGAVLACFPELGITGHAGHPAMVEGAEPVPGGPSVERLAALAAELDMVLCAGIAEDDRGIHYNTQFLVGPRGYIGKQRKVHLSADEHFYFRGGTALPVFDLPFARAGIIICYDNCLPEVSRCLAVGGAELFLCPHAARSGKWRADPAARRKLVRGSKAQHKMVHCCRAYDNGVYVALCNTAGRSAVGLKGVEANHLGGCLVMDPYGKVVAESRSRDVRDEMLVVDLDGQLVAARRRSTCFNLQTRRPEVFASLAEPTL